MQSCSLPASCYVPGAQSEHNVLSSGRVSPLFGEAFCTILSQKIISVLCNTHDCIWKRKIWLFEGKSKLLDSSIDAHSNCTIFLLSLQKISKFYQLRNSKRWMLFVIEKGFLHAT